MAEYSFLKSSSIKDDRQFLVVQHNFIFLPQLLYCSQSFGMEECLNPSGLKNKIRVRFLFLPIT